MTVFCSMRGKECGCAAHECRASKPASLAEAVMIPSWKTQLITCAFLGMMSGLAFFAAMSVAEQHQKITDQINQEAHANVKGR